MSEIYGALNTLGRSYVHHSSLSHIAFWSIWPLTTPSDAVAMDTVTIILHYIYDMFLPIMFSTSNLFHFLCCISPKHSTRMSKI